MKEPRKLPKYTWGDSSSVLRLYIVMDNRGRFGIAIADPVHHPNDLLVYPIDLLAEEKENSLYFVVWSYKNGTYCGTWQNIQAENNPDETQTLTILKDLGWHMPDWIADQILSQQKISALEENEEVTISKALAYCEDLGITITERGFRKACEKGNIPGAHKVGRDWLVPYEGLMQYLSNRPRPGRKKKEHSKQTK